MTQIGVPVPAGFTITTDACRAYMAEGKRLPDGLEDEIARARRRLEERAGKSFGDPSDPLLVSVRSGAAVSMPGMMDTILNLGLSDARPRGSRRRRTTSASPTTRTAGSIQMYGEVVDGIDAHRFEQRLDRHEAGARACSRTPISTPTTSRGLVGVFKAIYERGDGQPVPAGRARAADARRARRLRVVGQPARAGVPPRARHPGRPRHRRQRHADGLRQQGRHVGDGRLLHARSRRRASRGSTASSSPNAQGEDVVAGIRTPRAARGRCRRRPARGVRPARRDDGERSSATTATCRTSSSRSRRASSSSSRRAREAHRGGRAEGGRVDGRGGADHARGGGRAHRPGVARPAAAPANRSERASSRRRRRA